MIEAADLTKTYDGLMALQGFNLRIERGDIYCLLGANGAGKTTTINLFLGFIAPTSGRASIDGLDVQRHPVATKRLLGYVPEQVSLYPYLTGIENLRYFAELGTGGAWKRGRLIELLERVGLRSESADRRVATYSKGMRQKIAIALAFAKNAKVLFLDEPISGLDPEAANELCALLSDLGRQGTAVLMATHDLFRAVSVGTRVGIMKHGRLVADLTTEELGHADIERIYLDQMMQ